jgi:hypothetical protein
MAIFARYWFGLNDEEFGELTPRAFWDLWQQRQIDYKREQYLQGIVASMIAASHGAEGVTPFDFVSKSAEEAQREEIVLALKKSHQMFATVAPDVLTKARAACLARLQAQNIPDAIGIVEEVFGTEE